MGSKKPSKYSIGQRAHTRHSNEQTPAVYRHLRLDCFVRGPGRSAAGKYTASADGPVTGADAWHDGPAAAQPRGDDGGVREHDARDAGGEPAIGQDDQHHAALQQDEGCTTTSSAAERCYATTATSELNGDNDTVQRSGDAVLSFAKNVRYEITRDG